MAARRTPGEKGVLDYRFWRYLRDSIFPVKVESQPLDQATSFSLVTNVPRWLLLLPIKPPSTHNPDASARKPLYASRRRSRVPRSAPRSRRRLSPRRRFQSRLPLLPSAPRLPPPYPGEPAAKVLTLTALSCEGIKYDKRRLDSPCRCTSRRRRWRRDSRRSGGTRHS